MKRIIISFIAFFLLLCIPMAMQSKRSTPILLDDDNTATGIHGYVEDSLTHNRLANVSITLLRNGKPLKFTRTKEDGTFVLSITESKPTTNCRPRLWGIKRQKHRFHREKKPSSVWLQQLLS